MGRDESFSDADIRSRFPRFSPEALAANQPIVDLVREIAERKQISAGQVALAWLLAKAPGIVPIPGSRKPERVAEDKAAAAVALNPADVAALATRTAPIEVAGARGSGHETHA